MNGDVGTYIGAAQIVTATTNPFAPSSAPNADTYGLSVGAIVGIVLGFIGFVILVLVAAYFCKKRHETSVDVLIYDQWVD